MLGLRNRLYNLVNQSKNYKSLKDLFDAHDETIRLLEGMGEVISKVEKINTVLVAIPEDFKHIIGTLSVVRKEELEAMSVEQVKRLLLDEECSKPEAKPAVEVPVALVGQ